MAFKVFHKITFCKNAARVLYNVKCELKNEKGRYCVCNGII